MILSTDKNKNNGGRGSRKHVFEPYMTSEDVSRGLKRGELIQVHLLLRGWSPKIVATFVSRDSTKMVLYMNM